MPSLKNIILLALVLWGSPITIANAQNELSRKWEGHLWIKDYVNFKIEHTDVVATVYHSPNNTLRVVGRFSNGLQTRDVTFSLTIFAELTNGEVYVLQMYERVPQTGAGRTNVSFKSDLMSVPGNIAKVTAFSGVVSSGLSVGIKIKCKTGQKGTACSPKDGKYSKKPGVSFETSLTLPELDRVNQCAGVKPTSVARNGSFKITRACNVNTGQVSESIERAIGVGGRPTP